jgi:hypothetical protein
MILRMFFIAIFFISSIPAQAQDSTFNTAEGLAAELYTAVSFPPGKPPDWDRVKSMFLPQAVIQLRTSRDSTSIFDVNGFVADFVRFIRNFRADSTGFAERVVRTKPMVYGDMAHILVLYEASIPGSKMPPQQGVDSFSLVKKYGRWWIASITNEIPTKSRPVPEELRGKE